MSTSAEGNSPYPQPVENSTPATRLVWVTLSREGAHTYSELEEATALSQRTIRRAVDLLKDHDLAESRPAPLSPRTHKIHVVEEADEEEDAPDVPRRPPA